MIPTEAWEDRFNIPALLKLWEIVPAASFKSLAGDAPVLELENREIVAFDDAFDLWVDGDLVKAGLSLEQAAAALAGGRA